MKKPTEPTGPAVPATGLPLSEHMSGGLAQLLRAFDYAAETGRDVWEFAVEIREVHGEGMTNSDFRWLIAKGFAQHGRETTLYDDPQRSFRPSEGLTFAKTTAFVLTSRGAAFLRDAQEVADVGKSPLVLPGPAATLPQDDPPSPEGGPPRPSIAKPAWDARSRELRLDGLLVKKFRVPAGNQERVLSAFQEEAWPEYIDDPLPKTSGIEPKRRLHYVINRLNRGQVPPRIHFRGNGSGEGVGWEVVENGTLGGPSEVVPVQWQPSAKEVRKPPAAESSLQAAPD